VSHADRARWNKKYRGAQAPRRINARLQQFAPRWTPGRVLDLAGGMGQNALWLTEQTPQWRAIVADISDVALQSAAPALNRVLCDASALPFPAHAFDAILCTRFFDPRIIFAEWLAPGGVVFFETFTVADAKYNPTFNPAHYFDLAAIPRIFADLQILQLVETDDGQHAFVTIVAQRQKQ